jgi:hypothetical protein
VERAAERLDPIGKARRPDPLAGSAPPMPSSDTSTTTPVPFVATRTRAVDARAYFATLVSASAIW